MKQTLLIASLVCTTLAFGQSTADFDYFDYHGHDAHYDQQPLITADAFHNPILPGWYSDPSICRCGDDYFLVTSTFGYYPGVPIFHSRDLLNWQQIGHVLDRPSQLSGLSGQSIDRGGIYAPHISYNPANGLFYMITTDVGRGSFYVTCADPLQGHWSDPIWLPQIDGIDPSFFFDDNGEAYIVHKEDVVGQPKHNNHRAIRICRFDTKKGIAIGADQPMREQGTQRGVLLDRDEGPHIYKVGSWYYLLCAEGGTGNKHSAVVYRSRKVMGTWERYAGNPILTQRDLPDTRPNKVTCAGHADLVQTPTGDWWAVFLACRPHEGGYESLGRETFMLPVEWTADSFPRILPPTTTVPLQGMVKGATRHSAVTFGNFSKHDDFSSTTLSSEWMSLRGAVDYKLNKGFLCLTANAETVSGYGTPAFLCRRIQHHAFSAETALRLNAQKGHRAGLLIFKNESHHYFFAVEHGAVSLLQGDKRLATTKTNTSGIVKLKVESDGQHLSFWYKTKSRWTLLVKDISAKHTSSSIGGFCGTMMGLYAENTSLTDKERVLASIKAPTFPDRTFNILNYRQPTDSLYTEAFQRAIQACHEAGGGHVVVPQGDYETGPIRLLSNVDLHLDEGAIVRFTTDTRLFPTVLTRIEGIDCYNISPLIYAYNAENIAITGHGIFDGQGSTDNWLHPSRKGARPDGLNFNEKFLLDQMLNRQAPIDQRVFFGAAGYRPQTVNLYRCKNILLEDFEIRRSPFWLLHPLMSENITVRRVKMLSHNNNNDGCDPESCRNVLIEDCDFDTGDDCIAIKSGKDDDGRRWHRPCENIIVRRCRMRDGHAAVALGSEISGGCRNVWVEDCEMSSPNLNRIIRIKSNPVRGGEVSNVYVSGLKVGECSLAILGIELKYWFVNEGPYPPYFHDVHLENITSQKSQYLIHIEGATEGQTQVRNISFKNCNFSGITSPAINQLGGIEGLTFDHVRVNGSDYQAPDQTLAK